MSWRTPRHYSLPFATGDVDALQYEILQEKAVALARQGRRLDEALRTLEAFDAARAPGSALTGSEVQERTELVAAAGEALWYYIVQREACGLRDSEGVLAELRVPREVRLRMGFFPRKEP